MVAAATSVQGLRVRRAADADLRELAKVRVASWHDAYQHILPPRALKEVDEQRSFTVLLKTLRQRRRGGRVLLVEAAHGGPFGYTLCGPGPSRKLAGEIFELYVHPQRQQRGAGRMLLSAAIWELVSLGLNPPVVWVLAANPARHFYESCGGELVARGTIEFGGRQLPRLAYAWRQALPLPPLSAA